MAHPDKAGERSTLIFQLGRLLAPIYDLVEKQTPPTSPEYQVAAARLHHDLDRWREEARKFVEIGGVTFGNELNDIIHGPNVLVTLLGTLSKQAATNQAGTQSHLKEGLKMYERETIDAINRVPIEWERRLFTEKTPFSSYLGIRDAISTARQRIHYFDRYVESSFYSLYLRDLDRSLEIRIVTTRGNKKFGIDNIVAVSRLVSQEFSNYQLIECQPADMHERNLRIDATIFFLGASINQAGKYPTSFAPGDSTARGHQALDSILTKGIVIT
jgi:hypothetical protein